MGLVSAGAGPEQYTITRGSRRVVIVDVGFPVYGVSGTVIVAGADGDSGGGDSLVGAIDGTIYIHHRLPVGIGGGSDIS